MVKRAEFRFELANSNHRLLIQQWFGQMHVQKILYELGQKKVSLEAFLQGKSPVISHWIGYYLNVPLAFLISDSSHKDSSITLDVILCDSECLTKGLLTPLLYEFWKQTEDFWRYTEVDQG